MYTENGIADEFNCMILECHPGRPLHLMPHTDIHVAMEDRRCSHSELVWVGFARTGRARGPRTVPDSHREAASVSHLRNKTAPITLDEHADCRFHGCL